MKVFKFLYYCLYRMFALVKRVGEKDENLASSFYAILLSTNTIIFFFPLKFIIPNGFFTLYSYNILIKIMFVSIFFIWYFTCKKYFLKKGNYIKIISHYEEKYIDRKIQMAIIGIVYSILTPLIFISLAIWLSKIEWHL